MQKVDFSSLILKLQREKNVSWIGLRYSKEKTTYRVVRNELSDRNISNLEEGIMLEVLIDGHFGYSATANLTEEGIRSALEKALCTTKIATTFKASEFSEKQRPRSVGTFTSPREKNLSDLDLNKIIGDLSAASQAMKISDLIVNRSAMAMLIETQIDFYSSNGSQTNQNFNMTWIHLSSTAVRGSESQSRSFSKTGQWGAEIFNREELTKEAARIAKESIKLLDAENCPEGKMDLILMPDQMMLQIHESIGHPLELDRILGDERNYAGWSFVDSNDFGNLQYGSKLMNISFDPTRSHEFASYAFDDAGNPATKEYLIKDGLLIRGLGSLESQERSGIKGVANYRASSWNRAPIDRMANINLEPGNSTLQEMISKVKYGILMSTNRSWSIDDYRNKFQFGCEHGALIENGKITKIVKNPNYRGTTVDFWNKLIAVGNNDSFEAHGTPHCGKGEPNQVIRVGHAAPPCLFKDIEVFGGQA